MFVQFIQCFDVTSTSFQMRSVSQTKHHSAYIQVYKFTVSRINAVWYTKQV